jgi:2-polyprenyl-3-methyl-5-hydroxy-6-metoxy-1,4-benzoquinol methylase
MAAQPLENYHDLVRADVFPILPDSLGKLLDFGGGVGATSAALKRMGRATTVVVADQVGGQLDEVDSVHRGDLESEQFVSAVIADDGPFDTILVLDILEHLRDPWRIVEMLRDGLRPNGVIVASIPNVNSHRLLMPLVLRGRYALADSGLLDRTHLRWFAKHGAIELMTPPGLVLEELRPNVVRKREIQLNRITFGLFTRFLALQYLIRSRRVG